MGYQLTDILTFCPSVTLTDLTMPGMGAITMELKSGITFSGMYFKYEAARFSSTSRLYCSSHEANSRRYTTTAQVLYVKGM